MNMPRYPLDELVQISGGGTPSKKRPEYFQGSIPWVTPKDMKRWDITDSIDHISEEAVANSTAKMIEPGTVLVVIRSGVLKHSLPVAIARVPLTVNQDLKALRGKSHVHPEYLARVIKASEPSLLWTVRGTTADNISTDVLRKLEIPLPPLPEQRRIAAILDQADAIRRKRQKAIELTEKFLKSAFLEMFGDPVTNPKGWDVGPLSRIVSQLQGGKNIKTDDSAGSATRFFILKVSAVTRGTYLAVESKPVPKEFEPPADYFVRSGDLLISRANTRELIGATAFVWETPDNIILPDKIWRFCWQDPQSIEPLFVHYLMNSRAIRREIGRRASGTSGSMKNIAKPKLLSIDIPIPPLNQQSKFAELVRIKWKLGEHNVRSADSSELLFKSLTERAFRGELSPVEVP